ncbi:MAG TPA: hypothetical protein VG308_01810 [Stellaceae bacterium]|jgi:hypothetical protein|nr:hypothetical protein [Stellaceae bacterium]
MTGKFVAPALAALLLAQASSNLGIPQTPGTRVPESNPATSIVTPQSAPPPASASASGPAAPAPAPSGNSGPAYSFGAAPPPVVSPGH